MKSETRKMKSICIVAASSIMTLLAGCGDKSFSDVNAFVEKYVREDIAQMLGGFDEKWGFSGVEFADVRSELVQSFDRPIETITCEVTLVPKAGVSHYIPIAWQVLTEEDRRKLSDLFWGSPDERSVVTGVVSIAHIKSLQRQAAMVKESLIPNLRYNPIKPLVCVKVPNFKNVMTATVYRAKDDNGVFRPVKKDAMQHSLVKYVSKLKFDISSSNEDGPFGDDLITEKHLAELGGIVSGSDDARSVQVAFSTSVRRFADCYGAFTRSCKEYETAWTFHHERKVYEAERRQRLFPAQQDAERLISAAKTRFIRAQQTARNRANDIPKAERKRDNANRDFETAKNALTRAEITRTGAEERLTAARAKYQETSAPVKSAVKNLQQSESKVIACEQKVEKMKALAESAELAIVRAKNAYDSAKKELAEAETAHKQTDEEQAKRLRDLKAAIEADCEKKLSIERTSLAESIKKTVAELDEIWASFNASSVRKSKW